MGRFMVECRRPWRSQWEFYGVYKHGLTSANTSALRRVGIHLGTPTAAVKLGYHQILTGISSWNYIWHGGIKYGTATDPVKSQWSCDLEEF